MGWEEGQRKYESAKAERRAQGEKFYMGCATEGRVRWMDEGDKARRRIAHMEAILREEERNFSNPLSKRSMSALWEACRRLGG